MKSNSIVIVGGQMKKILSLIAFFIVMVHPVFADTQIPEKIDLKIDFQYEQSDKSGLVNKSLLKNNLKISTNIHDWMLIGGQYSKNEGNLMLLGNVDSADAEKITLNFLVIKRSDPQPIIISQPKLIVYYGQKGEILLKEDNTSIRLSVNAVA